MLGKMSKDNTPTPEAVAQAIDTLREVTGVHRLPQAPQLNNASPRSWHGITIFLSAVLAVGTVVGVLGRAFYVGRDEYTASETASVVSREAIRQTLDRVDRQLVVQTLALTKLSETLQAQAVELATIKYRSGR